MKNLISLLLVVQLFTGCDSDRLYEKNIEFEDRFWRADDSVEVPFEIQNPDTLYSLFFNIRNSNTYPYHNLFIKYRIQTPKGDTFKEGLVEFHLFDPQTGKPLGAGLGDIFEHRMPLVNEISFTETGEYNLSLQQYMRMDTLPEILSAGMRLEFIKPKP